jgi:DNA repair protein RadA/Sms
LSEREAREVGGRSTAVVEAKAADVKNLSDAEIEAAQRTPTNISELDRVLGGGIVAGSLVLLSGEPGIGKSTLAAMIGQSFSAKLESNAGAGIATPVLYASGEESASQLSGRLKRLNIDLKNISYVASTVVEAVAKTIEKIKPPLAIIDSVQTLSSSELDVAAGGVTLVRYATSILLDTAKRTGVPIVLVGQVTKDGSIAGPKTLEHLVDAVLILEGAQGHSTRILRATKNRFGSTDEVGVFEMKEEGLVGVENPSAHFLEERAQTPGSVITAALEGSRVFLVEVQALVETSVFANPVRRAAGFSEKRLLMLSAILSRRAGVKLADKDIYVNVVGGLRLTEPAADLAVCLAIAEAMRSEKTAHPSEVPSETKRRRVVFGEVGLGGEFRKVPGMERREKEAKRLGFEIVVSPTTSKTLKGILDEIN